VAVLRGVKVARGVAADGCAIGVLDELVKKPGAITRKAAKAARAAKTQSAVSKKGKRENN
jgi:hypothetical protein